mgnify:CR=1 FL=1
MPKDTKLYDILGVTQTSTDSDIKKVFMFRIKMLASSSIFMGSLFDTKLSFIQSWGLKSVIYWKFFVLFWPMQPIQFYINYLNY